MGEGRAAGRGAGGQCAWTHRAALLSSAWRDRAGVGTLHPLSSPVRSEESGRDKGQGDLVRLQKGVRPSVNGSWGLPMRLHAVLPRQSVGAGME